MSRLFYIESSPRKKRSSSIEVAHVFLDAYRKIDPNNQVETLDLWSCELPSFDGDVIDSKYAIMHGQAHTEAQRKAWRAVEQMIDEFKNADQYLFSLPMWNFTVPYKLKHFFDLIVQPSYTFRVNEKGGYEGMVTGKPAVIIYSRGGAYGSGTDSQNLDFQKPYMETILKFIGFTTIHSIIIEPTLGKPEEKERSIKQAKEEAIKLAESL